MKPFLSAVCIVLLLSGDPVAQAGELAPYDGPEQTPALMLQDLSGETHDLKNLNGNLVLVNFWASWCAPCLMEMPALQRLLNAMQDRPFDVLAVNVGESKAKAWRVTNMFKLRFTTLLDPQGAAARDWDVQIYPTSYLVDPQGRIRYVAYGALQWDSGETRRIVESLMPDR